MNSESSVPVEAIPPATMRLITQDRLVRAVEACMKVAEGAEGFSADRVLAAKMAAEIISLHPDVFKP